MPRLKHLKPKTVDGSSPLTRSQKDQLAEMFGERYHLVADGSQPLNRKERRRRRFGGRGQ